MLYYGVPAYCLPRDVIAAEVKLIASMGVGIRCDTEVGKDVSFDRLLQDFAAVVIAVGAKRSRALPMDGVHRPGVLGALCGTSKCTKATRSPSSGRRPARLS